MNTIALKAHFKTRGNTLLNKYKNKNQTFITKINLVHICDNHYMLSNVIWYMS